MTRSHEINLPPHFPRIGAGRAALADTRGEGRHGTGLRVQAPGSGEPHACTSGRLCRLNSSVKPPGMARWQAARGRQAA
jgi:hypothetical protein